MRELTINEIEVVSGGEFDWTDFIICGGVVIIIGVGVFAAAPAIALTASAVAAGEGMAALGAGAALTAEVTGAALQTSAAAGIGGWLVAAGTFLGGIFGN